MRHETPEVPFNPALLKKVEELKFSTRTANCMKREDIVYVGQMARMSESELLRTPDLGRTSLNKIKDALAQMGLHLGMEIDCLFINYDWETENTNSVFAILRLIADMTILLRLDCSRQHLNYAVVLPRLNPICQVGKDG